MRRRLLCLLACAAAAVMAPHPAAHAGGSKPYKGAFDFVTTDFTPLSLTQALVTGTLSGEETHLGRFEGEVWYVVDVTDGSFSGHLFKEAANGDLLYETLTGQFTSTGSVGEFVITGGTGRFLNAGGGGTFTGLWTDPEETTAHVTFGGAISYNASN